MFVITHLKDAIYLITFIFVMWFFFSIPYFTFMSVVFVYFVVHRIWRIKTFEIVWIHLSLVNLGVRYTYYDVMFYDFSLLSQFLFLHKFTRWFYINECKLHEKQTKRLPLVNKYYIPLCFPYKYRKNFII